MANFVNIRTKILKQMGMQIVNKNVEMDDSITARVMQPYTSLAIAWDYLQEVCEPSSGNYKVEQKEKMFYGRARRIFKRNVFGCAGMVYRGLTNDEISLFDDFIDKVKESVSKDMQILYYQLQAKMMEIEGDKRDELCKLLTAEILVLLAHDSIKIDMHKDIHELSAIAKSIHEIACIRLSTYLQHNISFEDKMFESALTILFKNITKVGIDGIQQE